MAIQINFKAKMQMKSALEFCLENKGKVRKVFSSQKREEVIPTVGKTSRKVTIGKIQLLQ